MPIFREMPADWMTEEFIFIMKMRCDLSEDVKQNMILSSWIPLIRLVRLKDCLLVNFTETVTMH